MRLVRPGNDLWNVLVRELRGLPAVYFLGSVRQEDVNLISNHSDTEFVAVTLGKDLAETVWQKLLSEKQTNMAPLARALRTIAGFDA